MILVRYGQTNARLEASARDVRGLTVSDINGQDLGSVVDMYFDLDSKRVRFLEVAVGGFLGLGERHFLVDAADIKTLNNRLVLDKTRDEVLSSVEGQTIQPMEAAPREMRAVEAERPTTMVGTYAPRETAEAPRHAVLKEKTTREKQLEAQRVTEGPQRKPATVEQRREPMMEQRGAEKSEARLARPKEEALPKSERPTVREEAPTPTIPGRRRWTDEDKRSIVGKTAQKRVRAHDGFVVLEKGDTITEKKIDEAEQHHALDFLMEAAGKK